MWFRNTPLVLALFGGVVPSVVTAQTSPRQAATEFLDAWNARRWVDAARLIDLDQFDRFRQDFITRARRAAGQRPTMTVEDLRRSDPDMPREVAEYQIRQMEEQQRRFADPTAYEFARVSSTSALRALGPEEAAARWLESRDPRWQVRMQFEQAGCPAPDDIETIPTPRRRLIGVVTEPGAGTYALYREERAADEIPDWAGGDLFVMELKQVRGRWAVVPRADLLPEVGNVDVGDCRRR
jgi:hypothetical protein